jgi:hypothetical protein
MKTNMMASPVWSTASFGDAAQTSTMDVCHLGEHLQHCSARTGHWAWLRCAAESMNVFVSARLVTSLAVMSLLLALLR